MGIRLRKYRIVRPPCPHSYTNCLMDMITRLVRFTVEHFMDFLKGINQLQQLLGVNDASPILRTIAEDIRKRLKDRLVQQMISSEAVSNLSAQKILQFGHHLRFAFKYDSDSDRFVPPTGCLL